MLLATSLAVAGQPAAKEGVITGTVVNASRGRTPEAASVVLLRLRLSGRFVPFEHTKTDPHGRFRFEHLPLGASYVYRPGANRSGVHYPGPAVVITPQRPAASVELAVWDSVAEPSPLVIRRQEVVLRHEPGAVSVTESMLIENPGTACYVGRARPGGADPITLKLAIPPEFARVTFQEEFYGRRFAVVGGKPATTIPWPPGRRELKFTYVVPAKSSHYRWQRALDLPCDAVRVRVENAKADEVACNLRRKPDEKSGAIAFGSDAGTLPAGYAISLELGRLPMPFMAYARWLALAVLMLLIAGSSLALVRRRWGQRGVAEGSPPSQGSGRADAPARGAHAKRVRQHKSAASRRAA